MAAHIVTRFAPSPTGPLHLGHAWSAMQAHDFARIGGGRFLLRIEDIDPGRCRPEFVEAIYQDLQWLGLDWDGAVWLQSQRLDHYRQALDHLIGQGLVYRCWCTRSDVALATDAPQGDARPLYPGTCRGRHEGQGPHCWRLNSAKAATLIGDQHWHDEKAGVQKVDLTNHGDVVIFRKDAPASYHLAVTIDDAAQGVTDIVRGRDLFDATHIHRTLQLLLGLPAPHYQHHALIIDSSGERLAKRKRSPSIASLRAEGTDPRQLMDEMRAGRFPIGIALEGA